MRGQTKIARFFSTFAVFFLLVAFVVTCCFFLFFHDVEIPRDQLDHAAKATFVNVLVLTALFVGFDLYRRKRTVEKPVREIQQALDKITAGDFSVRLDPESTYGSYSSIMESINHMTGELGSVETLRSDFLANVSHEMKTPLSVIQNYGTLLQSPDLTEAERMKYARQITEQTRRLSSLMTNILKLNRLENQQIYPKAEPFNLTEQLARCMLQFEQVWEEREIEIDTDLQEDVLVRMDEELLELVWNNLLSNAFKFTPNGGAVRLCLKAEGEYVLVTVADTGIGMTAREGARIFEKFYQADSSRATAGNGLGLALVKRIMDIVGGEITVSSTPGAGSTFTVRLRNEK